MNVMQLYTSKLETKLRAIQLVSTHINLYTYTHTNTHKKFEIFYTILKFPHCVSVDTDIFIWL